MNRFHTLYSLSVPVLLLSLCLFLSSCAGDDITSTSQNSGDTTIVKLSFCISDGNQTRAINSGNENIVSDITVLVFDNTNSLIGSTYSSSIAAGTVDFPVTTRSATGCTIYAIANTRSSSYFAGVNTIDKLNTMYTTIASAEALESSGSTAGSIGAMMIGKASVDITKGAVNKFPITLYHQCSKFTFTITPASGVTITGYQLCHVPLSSYITDSHVPTSASTAVAPPAGSYGDFDEVSGLSSTAAFTKTYYVYENLCGSNSSATSTSSRNNTVTDASYLLINAKGSGWTSTYRINLGGFTKEGSESMPNFNVYRNLNYKYTITLGASGGKGDARVDYKTTYVPNVVYQVGNYIYYNRTQIGYVFQGHLAVALTDASTSCTWYNASSVASRYTAGGESGWRLPTRYELEAMGGTTSVQVGMNNNRGYWSGPESGTNYAIYVSFRSDGSTLTGDDYKSNYSSVRAVLAF